MPSIKTFLKLVHKLNSEMYDIASRGAEVLIRMDEIDFTSIEDATEFEELKEVNEDLGKNFREVIALRKIFVEEMRKKFIQDLNEKPLGSKIKSLSLTRKSKSKTKSKSRRNNRSAHI